MGICYKVHANNCDPFLNIQLISLALVLLLLLPFAVWKNSSFHITKCQCRQERGEQSHRKGTSHKSHTHKACQTNRQNTAEDLKKFLNQNFSTVNNENFCIKFQKAPDGARQLCHTAASGPAIFSAPSLATKYSTHGFQSFQGLSEYCSRNFSNYTFSTDASILTDHYFQIHNCNFHF